MFYSHKNCYLSLNGNRIIALDASISTKNQLAPVYLGDQRHAFDYVPDGPIDGALKFSYYLTGNDFVKNYILEEDTFISGDFGGLRFYSGCLKSYSINGAANQPIVVDAEINFFNSLEGNFSPSTPQTLSKNILRLSDAVISGISDSYVDISTYNIESFSYQFNSNLTPVYRKNETSPYRIAFKEKTISSDVKLDNYDQYLPLAGDNINFKLTFADPDNSLNYESYEVHGTLMSKTIGASIGDSLTSSFSVQQNYVDEPPTITVFYPSSAYPEEGIIIHGTNFHNTISVDFNGAPAYDIFDFSDGTEITCRVPYEALSGPITVKTYGGTVTSTDSFTVNDPGIQVYGYNSPSGNIGNYINISGDNFYRISDVVFGATGSVFNVINRNLIQATIPEFATYSGIKVISALRNQTGIGPYKFVPIPRIDLFSPYSGITGATISIWGRGFSSVTGVTFNNLQSSYTYVNNTGIRAIVPSGNALGYIRLNGYSGVSSRSSAIFYPQIEITRLQPSTVYTGYSLIISGNAFIPPLLYNTTTNKYLVRFSTSTGEFTLLNDHVLSGVVPSGTQTGPVQLYNSQGAAYPSNQILTVRNPPPILSYMQPSSGRTGDLTFGYGQNLFNLTAVKFSGVSGIYSSSSISNSIAGNLLTATIPNVPTGIYHVYAVNSEGSGYLQTGYRVLTPYTYATATNAFHGQNSGLSNKLSFGHYTAVGPQTNNDYIVNDTSFPLNLYFPATVGLNFGAGNGYPRTVYVDAAATQNVNLYISNPVYQVGQTINGTWDSTNGATGNFTVSVF